MRLSTREIPEKKVFQPEKKFRLKVKSLKDLKDYSWTLTVTDWLTPGINGKGLFESVCAANTD